MLKGLFSRKPKLFYDQMYYKYHPVFRENSFSEKTRILCKEITTDLVDYYLFGINLEDHDYVIHKHAMHGYRHGIYSQYEIYKCGFPVFRVGAVPEKEDAEKLSIIFDSMLKNNIDEKTIYDVMLLGSIHIALKITQQMLKEIYNADLPLDTIVMLQIEIQKAQAAFGLKYLTLGI